MFCFCNHLCIDVCRYGPAVDTWLSHSIVSPTADICVKAMDFVWLVISTSFADFLNSFV